MPSTTPRSSPRNAAKATGSAGSRENSNTKPLNETGKARATKTPPKSSPRKAAKRTPEATATKASPRKTPDAASGKAAGRNTPGSSPKRQSPRLAARREAARLAAHSVAAAVRERVWAEARTDDGTAYYYHLSSGATAWQLPKGVILRSAGRNSIVPLPSRPSESECSLSPSSASDGETAAEQPAPPAQPAQPAPAQPELSELLGTMVSWLDETKQLYKATQSDMERLRHEHSTAASAAKEALADLTRRQAEGAGAAAREAQAAPNGEGVADAPSPGESGHDLSAWAAECAQLRDVVRGMDSKLCAERARAEALEAEVKELKAEAAAAPKEAGVTVDADEVARLGEELSAAINGRREAEAELAGTKDALEASWATHDELAEQAGARPDSNLT